MQKRDRGRENWVGGVVEVARFLGTTLFQHGTDFMAVTRLSGWVSLSPLTRMCLNKPTWWSSVRCLFQPAGYFAGCHLLVTLQKPPTGFIIFICMLMTSASFVISVNHVLPSVNCSLWQPGSGLDPCDFYVFWLNLHCTITPQQTSGEAPFLHSIPVNLCGFVAENVLL